MGDYSGRIGEDIVDEAPVVGVERAHLDRLAARHDPLGDASDFLAQAVFLDRPEVAAVHLDTLGLGQVFAEDAVDEVLEVVEPLAILANEEFTLARVNLQAGAVVGFLLLDGRRETQVPQHRVEDLVR